MDQHFTAAFHQLTQLHASIAPLRFKACPRHGDVSDGQVIPDHAARPHRVSHVGHGQGFKLMILHQGHDCTGAPVPDRIEVYAKITVPLARVCGALLLTRAERDADLPCKLWAAHFSDLKGVAEAGFRSWRFEIGHAFAHMHARIWAFVLALAFDQIDLIP